MPRRVLLTGSTGFIGRHLHPELRRAGYDVRCLTRHPEEARRRWPGADWVAGDVGDPGSLARALAGCAIAYYLVHGMGSGRPGWADVESRWAEDFAVAAGEVGVERAIYLGGVRPRGVPSEHLRARLATGEALRGGPVPCLELRAGMIVGAGSASWTIVRDLAARLPAMVLPAWLRHRSEPVGVDDVVAALVAAARLPLTRSEVWDLPGPEVISGEEILRRVAAVMGRRPVLVGIPLVTPRLSSYWIRFVTRADHRLAAELVEGLTSDLLAERPGFWREAGLEPPVALEEATRRALAEEAGHVPLRSWALEIIAGALTRRA
jgi:uncharacterized protein YbjT (DUF2867 family)